MRDFIVQVGIRYVRFDATRAAGFTEALRIAQLAEQHGVMLAPQTASELPGHLVLAAPHSVFGVESHGGRKLIRWLMGCSPSLRRRGVIATRSASACLQFETHFRLSAGGSDERTGKQTRGT